MRREDGRKEVLGFRDLGKITIGTYPGLSGMSFSDMPLACLGWPLTIAALSRASPAIFRNLGNSFEGFQHMASKRQFKLM